MVPDSSLRRPAFLSVLRFIHDRNPFYLLSALSMFIGFRAILGEIDSRPGDWKTLLDLIITLNIYEVVMIALALCLIVGRGLERDGWILLGIEALFLVDLTNLNAELFTAMPRLGGAVNSICFALAIAKILVIVRTLRLRLPATTLFYIALQLVFLFALPGIFRLMRSSSATVSTMQIYSVWWIAGLLIAAGAMLVKREPANDASSWGALPFRLYVMVPLLSLLVHLASENRVYWVHFQPANLAPIFLSACFALNRSKGRQQSNIVQASLGLVGLALLVSIVPTEDRLDLLSSYFAVDITPMRVTVWASVVLLVYLTLLHRTTIFAKAAAIGLVMAKIAANPQEAQRWLTTCVDWCYAQLARVIPQTEMEWGIVAIASAFLLLAVGAVVSLYRAAPPLPESEMAA